MGTLPVDMLWNGLCDGQFGEASHSQHESLWPGQQRGKRSLLLFNNAGPKLRYPQSLSS
jgi:hypothetical protein